MKEEEFVERLTKMAEDEFGIKIKAIPMGSINSDVFEHQAKIVKCLPCIEKTFAQLSEIKEGKDVVALAGQASIRVLIRCIENDIRNLNTDYTERLLATLLKFVELVGLDFGEDEDFEFFEKPEE